MNNKRTFPQLLAVLALVAVGLGCASSSDDTEGIRTLVAPTSVSQIEGDTAPGPTEIPATDIPAPTPTPVIEGLLGVGTYLVGEDLDPGIYVGLAGTDLLGSCYWARLSNLTGSDDILANDNAVGQFYLEVLPDDVALETGCELLPIDKVPARGEILIEIPPGMYIIGRDIEAGTFVGIAGEDLLDSCYWARLSNLTGDDDILANDNAVGLYYIEVLPDDNALQTGCALLTIEQVPARGELLTVLPPGTYIVGRDIEVGRYRGQAGDDFLDSCYWARLSNLSGDNDILANDNAMGQYFIDVLATDFALSVSCEVERTE